MFRLFRRKPGTKPLRGSQSKVLIGHASRQKHHRDHQKSLLWRIFNAGRGDN